jgi:hypothetical protein
VVVFSLFNLFFSLESRDRRESVFSLSTFADRACIVTTGASLFLLVMATVLTPCQAILKTTALDVDQWLLCAAVALSIIAVTEIRKAFLRKTVGPVRLRRADPVTVEHDQALCGGERSQFMTRSWRGVAEVLGDPRTRLGLGIGGLLGTAVSVRRDRVGPREARVFLAVNGLTDALYPAAWVVMQAGAFGAVPAASASAWLTGDRVLAGRLLAGGTAAWALSKLVKQAVRRPRPAVLLPGTRGRGRDASGLGYLSGHAAVAIALGAAALPRMDPAGRGLALSVIPLVGLTRIYVGAHLPLDVAGGVALGLAVEATAELVLADRSRLK